MKINLSKIKYQAKYLGIRALLLAVLSFFAGIAVSVASDQTQLSQSISGSLDVAVVDSNGDTVASPTVAFSAKSFSPVYQTSTATLGTSSERLRVTNPSGTTDTWQLNVAATGGATAVWTTGSVTYDFNDSTANATDGADADTVGGQLTINPSVGSIAGVGGTGTTNVSAGTSDAFVQGTKDSIDLMTAASGAAKPGQWDLTGVGMSQTIPANQASGSYTLDLTLTAT